MYYEDDDDEEQQRHKAEIYSMVWEVAFAFGTVAAMFVVGFLVVRWVMS